MNDGSTIGNAYIPVPDVNANTDVNGYSLHLAVAAIAPPTPAAAAPCLEMDTPYSILNANEYKRARTIHDECSRFGVQRGGLVWCVHFFPS